MSKINSIYSFVLYSSNENICILYMYIILTMITIKLIITCNLFIIYTTIVIASLKII